MSRAAIALVLEVAFFVLAFGWRSWVQWRRTGSTGFIRPRLGASAAETAGSVGFVLALALMVAAPIADMLGANRIDALEQWWIAAIGVVVSICGIVLTLVAQMAMGASWRIGVDASERTTLVTRGVFSRVRNPIFTAMVVATVGLVLIVPNVWAIGALVVLVATLEIQVRLVEEPYLTRTHGDEYERYRHRSGRFVPSR